MSFEPKLDKLRLDQLAVDYAVQRALDQVRSQRIADDFNPDAMGVLHVSARADGTYHILDGQHRRDAALKAGESPSQPVACMVYSGLTRQQEATLFLLLNATRGVSQLDKFRVRIEQGDPTAVRLNTMLHSHGWHLDNNMTAGGFRAVAALESIYNGGKVYEGTHFDVCEDVVRVITEAWGHNANGVRGEIINGLGAFLLRNRRGVDLHKLSTEMGKQEGGPLALIGHAKSLRQISGGNVAHAMAEILTNLHNKGRRSNRVPDWRRPIKAVSAA